MPLLIAAFLASALAPPPHDGDDNQPQALVSAPRTPERPGAAPAAGEPRRATADESDKDRKVGERASREDEADDDEEEGHVQPSSTIVVTARRLDAARMQIEAELGATVYSLTNDAIENRPGGETGTVADILAQVPGVTLAGKRLVVRGAAADQLRINDVIIPEAISDPADLISSRLAETTRLISGTLPAQYGFAPGGVISVTTKNGLYQHGGQAELFAGTDGMIEPAFEWAGSCGETSLFASGEVEHHRSRLADAQGNAADDRRTRIDGLAFADHLIDSNDRISLIVGGSHERHRIGATSIGAGAQSNDDGYGVATFQHSLGSFTVQSSLFAGTATDATEFGSATHERRTSFGTQIDASEIVDAANLLRFGLLATRSTARDMDFEDRSYDAARTSLEIYAQDEWKPSASLTFNPGARLEWLTGLGSAPRLEPRANLVWQFRSGLAAHVGYARYASAPPLAAKTAASGLPDERDDYVDIGLQQKLGPMTLGIDAYRRWARNYLAEYQPIGSAVSTPFEFRRGRIGGVELSATYVRGPTSGWANISLAHGAGKTLVGGEQLFAPQVIAAAAAHYVPLSSERPVIVSAGVTRRFGLLSLAGDLLLSSSAVHTTDLAAPNASRHSPYATLGFAAVYHVRIAGRPADLRLDLLNLTDAHYPESDATSLDGGWSRFGEGRAIAIGIEQGF